MSDAGSNPPSGGLPEHSASVPGQSFAQADQRWMGSKPLKVASTVLAAVLVAIFSAVAVASGSLIAAVITPITLLTLAAAGCYRLWRSGLELTGSGIVTVRTLLRTHLIPAGQILSMRRSEYGIRIMLIDGRAVTVGALQTGMWRQRSRRPDQAAKAIAAITQAVEAARSTQPGEIAAAIDMAAPIRAKRAIRRLVVAAAVGPVILIASFFVPDAGAHLGGRLRWMGIFYMPASIATAYSLLRLTRPGAGRQGRHQPTTVANGMTAPATGMRFPRCQGWAPGYQIPDVDALAERIEATLAGAAEPGQVVTAADVRAARFRTTRRGGYDEQAVDQALDRYAQQLDTATGKTA
jgi:DivIVA domain-containing protein